MFVMYVADTIYTERYMDTPQNNAQGYANSSLLTEEVVSAKFTALSLDGAKRIFARVHY